MKSDPRPCKDCYLPIYFDSERKSVNGKPIPINEGDDEPHDCPERARNDNDNEAVGRYLGRRYK